EQVAAQAGELVVVGDFDADAVRKLAQELLADWKSDMPYERIAMPALTGIKGGAEKIHTPDKANAIFLGGLHLPMMDSDPDFPALRIGNFVFGGDGLSSRLGNRVRQKEGLSYQVVAHLLASSLDKSTSFMIMANCKPTNMARLNKA